MAAGRLKLLIVINRAIKNINHTISLIIDAIREHHDSTVI